MVTIVLQTLVTIVCAVLASSGFWAWLRGVENRVPIGTLKERRLLYK